MTDFSPQKDRFEKQVTDCMMIMVNLLIKNIEEASIVPLSGRELYEMVKQERMFNRYVLNEASGRLIAIGFHGGPKTFSKQQQSSRNDEKTYYYKIDQSNHPLQIDPEVANARLEKRRKILDRKNARERQLYNEIYTMSISTEG